MLSEQDIELAHPDAFDFVFGTLGAAKYAWFNSHLDGCRHCQKVVAEYSDIGQSRLVTKVIPRLALSQRPRITTTLATIDREAGNRGAAAEPISN